MEKEEGLWQDIVRAKYIRGIPVTCIKPRQNDSPIWSDLLQVRKFYTQGRKFKCNNGHAISFWKDCWLDDVLICETYPFLYELCSNADLSVKECSDLGWVISFKRNLPTVLHSEWYSLADKLNSYVMGSGKDEPMWMWEKVVGTPPNLCTIT